MSENTVRNNCDWCRPIAEPRTFLRPDAQQFRSFHELMLDCVERKYFHIETGDLQWSDWIRCILRCAKCGRRFELMCETHHGGGGSWKPVTDRPPPTLTLGQRVRVILNDRNRTPHTGTIRNIIWHFKDQRYNYYFQENGRKVAKRYFEEDLEMLPEGN